MLYAAQYIKRIISNFITNLHLLLSLHLGEVVVAPISLPYFLTFFLFYFLFIRWKMLLFLVTLCCCLSTHVYGTGKLFIVFLFAFKSWECPYTFFHVITCFISSFEVRVRRNNDVMAERAIVETILDGYNIDIRPEIEHGVPMHVHFEMKLQKIVRLVSSW